MEYALVAAKTFVLGLTIHCQGCEAKLKRRLKRIHGVHTVAIDSKKGHITIKGTIDPQTVIFMLEKYSQKSVLLWEQPSSPKEDTIGVETDEKRALVMVDGQFGDSSMVKMIQQLSRGNANIKEVEVTITKNFKVVFINGEMKIVESTNSISSGNDEKAVSTMNNNRGNNSMPSRGEPVIGVPYLVSGQNIQGHHQHCCCQFSGHMHNYNNRYWPLPPAMGYYPPYQSVFTDENPNGCAIL